MQGQGAWNEMGLGRQTGARTGNKAKWGGGDLTLKAMRKPSVGSKPDSKSEFLF